MNLYSRDTVTLWQSILRNIADVTLLQPDGTPVPEHLRKILSGILNNYSLLTRSCLVEILSILLALPEYERSLTRFERFCEEAESVISISSYSDDFPQLVATVFALSGALSVRLTAAPEILARLANKPELLAPCLNTEYYHDSIAGYLPSDSSIAERIKAVHMAHTAELSRICARNADPSISIEDITAELSLLAEAVIDTCLAIASDELFGDKVPDGLFVLGLGKFGGCELNVSSDVDIIYLCDRVDGWHSFEDMTMHTRLAERLTQILTEATSLGYMYRVDIRLRADGASGPLVRTTTDYLRYLEMRGQAWERQMLLKARTVAGFYEGGERFLASIAHFIFPSSITRSPHREIVAIKNQIESRLEATGSKKTHLKLMPGGVRDIEFITQCLQLLTGGMHPEVRETGTLPALRKLFAVNALSENEFNTLTESYTLYRRIENALMWPELLAAFHIPDDEAGFSNLEKILSLEELRSTINNDLKIVRDIYTDIFSSEGDESFEAMAVRAALRPTGDDTVKRYLENLGFSDPDMASQNLHRLVYGETDSSQELDMHPVIEAFLPKYLKSLSELPDPGGALTHFRLITDAYKARSALFDIMNHNEKIYDLLLSITHASAFMTGMLANDPALFDWLVESGELTSKLDSDNIAHELADIDERSGDDITFARRCLRLKHQQKLRIGTRDITGLSEDMDTFHELTVLAELLLQTVYLRARKTLEYNVIDETNADFEFVVIAAGKMGSGYMDFGSDLDLIFLYRPFASLSADDRVRIPQQAITLAQRILTILGGGGVYRMYEVDARLRPEGGNSPLAVSMKEYERYFSKRASVWERLALVRAKPVCGDMALMNEAIEGIHQFVYGRQLTKEDITKIIAMRKTMVQAANSRSQGRINIKSGHGGITDIDFIAQSYACHYGLSLPAVRHRRTTDILHALADASILSKHDVSTLIDLFAFLMSVEKAARIGSGKSISALPKDGIKLARIARLLGYTNNRRFSRRLADVISLSGDLYDMLMNELLLSVDASSS